MEKIIGWLDLIADIVTTPEPERTEKYGTKWPEIVVMMSKWVKVELNK